MPSLRRIEVGLDVLNMRGDVLSSIDQRVVEGQVTVSAKGDGPTRAMTPTLYDPDSRLHFDSDSPVDGALSPKRQLRAWYSVHVPDVGWVRVPVFTGPILIGERNDYEVTLECQGREVLAMNPVWRVFTVPKGTKKTDAIRRIMRECAGETRFDIPDLPTRLGSHATLTPTEPEKRQKFNADTPWALCQKIAASMGRQLFYDGFGRLRLRNLPGDPVFTFNDGVIQSPPKVKFDMTKVRNRIKVVGKTLHEGKEKKGTPQIPTHVVSGTAEADSTHPLSPEQLGWDMPDGSYFRRVLPELVSNDAVRSDGEAKRLAEKILADRLRQELSVTLDALPIPHVEELDLVRVKYADLVMNLRLEEFTLPLTHEGLMSVGDVKKVNWRRGR